MRYVFYLRPIEEDKYVLKIFSAGRNSTNFRETSTEFHGTEDSIIEIIELHYQNSLAHRGRVDMFIVRHGPESSIEDKIKQKIEGVLSKK